MTFHHKITSQQKPEQFSGYWLQENLCELTRGCRFTNEGDQVFLDGVKSVKVVHDKHVSVGGLATNPLQLNKIHVGNTDGENAVTWRYKRITSEQNHIGGNIL